MLINKYKTILIIKISMLNDNKKIVNLHELLILDTIEENNIEKINNEENKYICKQFLKDFLHL
jgi:hypothetical protein